MIPFHPFAEIFPLIEGDAFDGLVESLRQDGYRPGKQVVLFEGKVLDGRNRYRAALAAGIAETDIPFRDFDPAAEGHPLDFVEAENINRRHLDTSQLAMVANRITTLRHGGQRGQAAKLPVERRHVTQAAAARRLGVSERSVRAARAVQDKGTPALTAAADRGHIPVSVAAKAAAFAPAVQDQIAAEAEAGRANVVRNVVKRNARDDKEKALAVKQKALPDKRYGVILGDPEWVHETWSAAGKDRAADNHYPVSGEDEIAARDVASIAANDCVLGLWTTDLARGLRVMVAWGFTPKSYRVWVKDIVPAPPDAEGRKCFVQIGPHGNGYWALDRDEILLIGTRGNVPCPAPGTQGESVFFAARPRDEKGRIIHSAKPVDAHLWFERHFPNLPKIELNARTARPGWDCWGLEAPEPAACEASA